MGLTKSEILRYIDTYGYQLDTKSYHNDTHRDILLEKSMAKKNGISIADRADRHQQLMIFAFFLMSLQFLAAAAEKFADKHYCSGYLDLAQIVFLFGAICIIVPTFVWKFTNLTKAQRRTYFDPEGYLFSITKKAMAKSWTITFCAMIFSGVFSKRLLAHLPPAFFINVFLAIMLGTFSIAFFVLQRADNDDDFLEETANV